VAFEVPKHKSLFYRRFLTERQLKEAVTQAISKGANVISIRKVVDGEKTKGD
jgi:hypothetical protein